MNSITQDMKFRQSLMKYLRKYGVRRASRKYNKARSYIYFWLSPIEFFDNYRVQYH